MKQIRANKVEQVFVEIDEFEEKRIVIDYIRKKFDLPLWDGDNYLLIKDNSIYDVYDEGRYTTSTFIRNATERDILALNILKELE